MFLKKSANNTYSSVVKEYLNIRVVIAYVLFLASTFLTIFAYKYVPLSFGPILETTSYIYITFFSVKIFKEQINYKMVLALVVTMVGIITYTIF